MATCTRCCARARRPTLASAHSNAAFGVNSGLATHDYCLVRCSRGHYAVNSEEGPAAARAVSVNSRDRQHVTNFPLTENADGSGNELRPP